MFRYVSRELFMSGKPLAYMEMACIMLIAKWGHTLSPLE